MVSIMNENTIQFYVSNVVHLFLLLFIVHHLSSQNFSLFPFKNFNMVSKHGWSWDQNPSVAIAYWFSYQKKFIPRISKSHKHVILFWGGVLKILFLRGSPRVSQFFLEGKYWRLLIEICCLLATGRRFLSTGRQNTEELLPLGDRLWCSEQIGMMMILRKHRNHLTNSLIVHNNTELASYKHLLILRIPK